MGPTKRLTLVEFETQLINLASCHQAHIESYGNKGYHIKGKNSKSENYYIASRFILFLKNVIENQFDDLYV